jgi:hypothetical protein
VSQTGEIQGGAVEAFAGLIGDFVSYARHIDAGDVVSPAERTPAYLKAA